MLSDADYVFMKKHQPTLHGQFAISLQQKIDNEHTGGSFPQHGTQTVYVRRVRKRLPEQHFRRRPVEYDPQLVFQLNGVLLRTLSSCFGVARSPDTTDTPPTVHVSTGQLVVLVDSLAPSVLHLNRDPGPDSQTIL